MKEWAPNLLVYLLFGIIYLGLICLFIYFWNYDPSFFENYIKCIALALFGLLFIAFFIVSLINFRDTKGNLVIWERVKIPKLYVAIGFFLIPLLVLSGGTVIKMGTLNLNDKPAEISSNVAGLSAKIDSLEKFLNSRIDSLIKAVKDTTDQ